MFAFRIRKEVKIMGWQDGGQVGDQEARTRVEGSRVEALWGGDGAPDGPGHGHIVSNDGLNADYVREPWETPVVDNNRPDPYS
jgi:hypothetical protein